MRSGGSEAQRRMNASGIAIADFADKKSTAEILVQQCFLKLEIVAEKQATLRKP